MRLDVAETLLGHQVPGLAARPVDDRGLAVRGQQPLGVFRVRLRIAGPLPIAGGASPAVEAFGADQVDPAVAGGIARSNARKYQAETRHGREPGPIDVLLHDDPRTCRDFAKSFSSPPAHLIAVDRTNAAFFKQPWTADIAHTIAQCDILELGCSELSRSHAVMRACFSIARLMRLVTVIAINVGAGRILYDYDGYLLAAIALQCRGAPVCAASIETRSARASRIFWAGFTAGLVLAAGLCLSGVYRGTAKVSRYDPVIGRKVTSYHPGSPLWPAWPSYRGYAYRAIMHLPDGPGILNRYDATSISVLAIVFFLPELLVAMAGGVLASSIAWVLSGMRQVLPGGQKYPCATLSWHGPKNQDPLELSPDARAACPGDCGITLDRAAQVDARPAIRRISHHGVLQNRPRDARRRSRRRARLRADCSCRSDPGKLHHDRTDRNLYDRGLAACFFPGREQRHSHHRPTVQPGQT